jgi:hypothetical protein
VIPDLDPNLDPNLDMTGTGQTGVQRNLNALNSFFNDPQAFSVPPGVSTGLTPQPDFDWNEMSTQAGIPPGDQGVLRSILTMGSMETMDLGWDSNQ